MRAGRVLGQTPGSLGVTHDRRSLRVSFTAPGSPACHLTGRVHTLLQAPRVWGSLV